MLTGVKTLPAPGAPIIPGWLSLAESALAVEEIQRRLKTHAVNFDDLASGNYDVFLENRAQIIEQAMKELCSGKHWEL